MRGFGVRGKKGGRALCIGVAVCLELICLGLFPVRAAAGEFRENRKPSEMAVMEEESRKLSEMAVIEESRKSSEMAVMEEAWGAEEDGNPPKTEGDAESQAPEDETPSAGIMLVIDNQNLYEGMDCSYSEGYIPRVENGCALVVIPLVIEGEEGASVCNNTLRGTLNLGESSGTPFVYKNYDRNLLLQRHRVNHGAAEVESFVASFSLELLPERYNGSYPVTLTVEGMDESGNALSFSYTVYVTITDGKDPNAVPEEEPLPEEPPVFAPKLLVESYRYSNEEIFSGDELTAEITLRNTSQSEQIRNLTVTVSAPEEYLTLLSPSDSVYIDSVPAGEACVVSFDCRVDAAAPEGQYSLELSMDYADAEGSVYAGSGRAKLSVRQPVNLEFECPPMPERMEVGDVTQVQVQAMNLGRGRVYNVRAELEADGLTPQGTIFIGDMEPGTLATGSTQISVGGLSEGNSPYGETEGTLIFYYEDASGQEHSQKMTFTAAIHSPFSEAAAEPEDEPGQWWALMAVITVLLCVCGGVLAARKIRRKQKEKEV